MAYSIQTKERAIKLRKKGFSIKEISRKFDISSSTSSLWLRNVDVGKAGKARLEKRKILAQYKTSLKWRQKRKNDELNNSRIAKNLLRFAKTDRVHCQLYTALLFWCEGGKAGRTGVRFMNSDPSLIRTFLVLFRKGFDIDENKFRALIHLHKYHDDKKQKLFWSGITKISLLQFNKSYIKINTGKRIRRDYPGCLAVYYHDAKLAREIKAIFKMFAQKMHGGVR